MTARGGRARLIEPTWRALAPGRRSRVRIVDTVTGEATTLYDCEDRVLEAPNWTPDGRWIVVNSAGSLFRIPVLPTADRPRLERIDTGEVDDLNNDHVVSPDGGTIYISSEGFGTLHAVPWAGGAAQEIADDLEGRVARFALGISPDGSTLYATVAPVADGEWGRNDVFAIPVAGGHALRLTASAAHTIGADGDDDWLYLNSERDARVRGHSQLYRMRPDGTSVERLTRGENVDWFAKLSPDGCAVAYVSFPPGTVGHETDVPVVLRVMHPDGTGQRDVLALHGGQGTMNVNSWAPDSRRLAVVDYPDAGDEERDA